MKYTLAVSSTALTLTEYLLSPVNAAVHLSEQVCKLLTVFPASVCIRFYAQAFYCQNVSIITITESPCK